LGTGEAVVGEDRIGANKDAIAGRHPVIDEGEVLHLAAITKHHVGVNEGATPDDAVGADLRTTSHHCAAPDLAARANGCAIFHDCRWINERRWINH